MIDRFMKREPNLVIVGAQKAGTTTLYHYLKSHPEIFMSQPVKEPGYFMNLEFIRRHFGDEHRSIEAREDLLDRYMLHGYNSEQYFGEASTYYTIGMRSRLHHIPARMKLAEPKMRLIYIVRNPFDRLVSHFLHATKRGIIDGGVASFVENPEFKRGLLTSCYWYQISAYLDEFPRQQVKVILFEDLIATSRRVVDEIYAFLELRSGAAVSNQVYNRSENRDTMDAAALAFPVKAYRKALRTIEPDVRQLAEFMGRDLDTWDLSSDRWCGGARDSFSEASGSHG